MSNVEVKFRLKEKLEKRQQYYDRQICGGPAALKYFRQTDIQTEATQIFLFMDVGISINIWAGGMTRNRSW